jgi:hypothetical protein
MKKFKEYINEEITPQALTDKNFVGVENSSVRDNINSLLNGVTTKSVVTPYVSLERVRKALAYYHIFLPAHQFMEGNSGNVIFNISQFGEKYGQTNTGEFVSKSDSPYFLYFEYQMNDLGLFDVFAEVVDDDELEELLGDYESEMDDSEEDDDDEDDTVVSADQQNNYLLNKDEHDGNLKEERLNELKKVAKRAEDKAAKNYYDAYDVETDARKKAIRTKTPEAKKEAEDAKARRLKAVKRVVKFQKYNDKKKPIKEETLNEGRPSQRHPLEGHEYHRKSDAELLYIGKDAHKAAEAMKGHNEKAEAKYLDQANDAATVRYFRKRSGMPNWYKKKYGHDKK